jgi:hypothetical protein
MRDYVNEWLTTHPGPVRPRMTLFSGRSLSVQASGSHYCEPRSAVGPWTEVEVGYPEYADGRKWGSKAFGTNRDGAVFGWVPVADLNRMIARNGGIKESRVRP